MTFTVDFHPAVAGTPVEPTAAGGVVTSMVLRPAPDMTMDAAHTSSTAVKVRPGLWRFTFPAAEVPAGRWWPYVTWQPSSTAAVEVSRQDPVDLPTDPALVVQVEEVLWRLGLSAAAVTDPTLREHVRLALVDAQADVEGFLARPLIGWEETVDGVWPAVDTPRWVNGDWPALDGRWDDTHRVVAAELATPPDVGWGVWVRVGLDAATNPKAAPVRRYLVAHAENQPTVARLWREVHGTDTTRVVTSVSTEGQSVGYQWLTPTGTLESTTPPEGAAGTLPTLQSLAGLRRLPAFRRTAAAQQPWPYSRWR